MIFPALPTLKFFHDGGSLNADLERVPCAYIIHAPDVGYVQGMSFVVAMLLLYLDDSEALSCFVNLLKRRGIGEFYHLQREALDAYVNCFDYFFEQSLPLLYHHLKREGLSSDMFLLDWHLTLFVKPLPLDCAARVWDVFLGADETYGLRIALGILRLCAPELSTMNLESLMSFLTRLPETLRADMLLQSVEEIKIPTRSSKNTREGAGKGRGAPSGRPRREGWLCASLINNYVFAHYISYIYKPRHIHIGDVSPLATRWTRSSPRPHRRPWTQRPRRVEALRPQQLKATRRTSCGPSLQPLSLSPCQLPPSAQPGSYRVLRPCTNDFDHALGQLRHHVRE